MSGEPEPDDDQPGPSGWAGAPGRADTLGALVTADGGDRPAVTFVDRAGGERTELGCATLANWADKTANLLTEELDCSPGDEVGVDAGSHWTTLVILLGAWRAGMVVRLGDADPAAGPAVVHEDCLDGAVGDDVLVVGGGMAGRPRGDAGGALVFPTDVLGMPDEFTPAALDGGHPALRVAGVTVSHVALTAAGRRAGELAGVRAGARHASARRVDTVDGLVTGALAAWSAGASLVLVADAATLTEVATAERADTVLDEPSGDPAVGLRCELAADGSLHVRA